MGMQDMNDTQQLKRGQVAPFNPDPRWPTGYFEVLEKLGVEERRRPFYAHWVRQFFNHQQKRKQRRDMGRREIEAFIQAQNRREESRQEKWTCRNLRRQLVWHYAQNTIL